MCVAGRGGGAPQGARSNQPSPTLTGPELLQSQYLHRWLLMEVMKEPFSFIKFSLKVSAQKSPKIKPKLLSPRQRDHLSA